eukprot:CAMPEP_0197444138 /NCGR_PEP_ID=MMETSP1175-20131217/9694_1 /TAXON_ID=1003142 /ORGANISM="Triceratium dubium, Strain CCMP147" /LENGTH=157 /DNA_ID=CAMNT_0042974873 /DNA_START=124 /DNA_END=594 /DNA_ORIENTATION=-
MALSSSSQYQIRNSARHSAFMCVSLLVSLLLVEVHSFVNSFPAHTTAIITHHHKHNSKWDTVRFMNGRRGKDEESSELEGKIDALLDSPVFDPDAKANEENWFAKLVKSDYATAEALYAGGFFALMVLISQELFRFWLYGENYVPFKAGGGAPSGMW